jgi:hypothetical protein
MIIKLLCCDLEIKYIEPKWRIALKKWWYANVSVPWFYLKWNSKAYHKLVWLIDYLIDFKNNHEFFIERLKSKDRTGYRIVWKPNSKGKIIKYYFNLRSGREGVSKNTNNFNSFFDTSTGQQITSLEQIKEMESKGMHFMTHDEAQRETRKYKKINDEAYNKRRRERIEQVVEKMSQGFSYADHYRKQGILKD